MLWCLKLNVVDILMGMVKFKCHGDIPIPNRLPMPVYDIPCYTFTVIYKVEISKLYCTSSAYQYVSCTDICRV